MRGILVGLVLVVGGLAAFPARAQVMVNPTGVNVRQAGPSTVFLTFRGLQPGQTVGEGIWCAALNVDNSCVAGTIFGRLPPRLDFGQPSAGNTFTDIMTLPASVSRRAYQRAESGLSSQFFYVRQFNTPTEFVPVTCRMAGGGARSPLAIMDIQVLFALDEPVLYVPRNSPPTRFGANIKYSGAGRFAGRWEIAFPGDTPPTEIDLLPESSLPLEQRALQKSYTFISRFDVFLPPKGSFFLPGPDPRLLPYRGDGLYQILLRIEATDVPFSSSFTGTGTTSAGGVAGFVIPPLRYYVGTAFEGEAIAVLASDDVMQPLVPRRGQTLPSGQPVVFHWIERKGAMAYRLDVRTVEPDEIVLSALVSPTVGNYTAPPFIDKHAGRKLEWRVIALGDEGDPLVRAAWVDFTIEP